jgi:hypothetical protein
MHIPERYLEGLRRAGLLVSEPFVPGHLAFPDGVTVGKPRGTGGHSIEGSCGLWSEDGVEIPLDAPVLQIHSEGGRWFVTSHDVIPGPGPADFVREFDRPEQAIADVIDFFFGDPARMDLKRLFHERGWRAFGR